MHLKELYKKSRAIGTFFVLALLFACSGKQEDQSYSTLHGNAIGTSYNITQISSGELADQEAIDDLISVFDGALSTYKPNSLLSIFNDSLDPDWDALASRPHFDVELNYIKEMIVRSTELYEITEGCFDPSAQELFELWALAKNKAFYPDSYVVRAAKNFTGMSKIGLDMQELPYRTQRDVKLNFNAIAKGYLVDVISEYLDELGVKNYMVEIGGEVRAKGLSPSKENWRIGVNTPKIGVATNDVYDVVELNNEAVATSGNYRNYFMVGDSIIGHTLDPRSGYPVNNSMRSATIIAPDCCTADALATACMVAGADASIEWLKELEGVRALFIIEDEEGKLKTVKYGY